MTTEQDLQRLGDAVRVYRELSGLTQDEISRRGGPSDVTIRGLEHGAGKVPNKATLRKIDRGFGWEEGTAEKILAGQAEVFMEYDEETGQRVPLLLDYTMAPPIPERTPEQWQAEYEKSAAAQEPPFGVPVQEEPTPVLITELAARFRDQERLVQQQRLQLASLHEVLASTREQLAELRARTGASGPEAGGTRRRGDGGDAGMRRRLLREAEHVSTGPWGRGQEDFNLAAMEGENRGRKLREEQDREAEGGGA